MSGIQGIQLAVFDFDGVFTDNRVWVFEDGREAVCCSRADGIGLQRLNKAGIEAFVLSSEPNPVVSHRCAKLKIKCIQGCEDKLSVLKEETAARGLDLKQVCYVGNDLNDLDCLRAVGWPVCVADACPQVLQTAKKVLTRSGGRGAVRELCDLLAAREPEEASC